MSDTADRLRDVMRMILGLQLSVIGLAFEPLFVLFIAGSFFTFAVYTNEIVRRRQGSHR